MKPEEVDRAVGEMVEKLDVKWEVRKEITHPSNEYLMAQVNPNLYIHINTTHITVNGVKFRSYNDLFYKIKRKLHEENEQRIQADRAIMHDVLATLLEEQGKEDAD